MKTNISISRLIVRMGCFYVIICLNHRIYSQFMDCGMIELLVEAGVGTEGIMRAVKIEYMTSNMESLVDLYLLKNL